MNDTSAIDITLEPADGPLAESLLARYYAELDDRFTEGFDLSRTVAAPAAELVAPRGAFLVAWVDGTAGGCGAVRMLDAGVAEIKRMWVAPGCRGRGVGSSMLAALEDVARTLGAGTVRLDTSAHLVEALRLYLAHGYHEIPPYNDNVYAAHWLEKRLG